jgi:DNA modification methylase
MPDSEGVPLEGAQRLPDDAPSGSASSLKKLGDFTQDARNANKGTLRGQAAIQDSLRKYGAGRSILVDRNGAIIAGNKTAENAGALGMDDVIVVQTRGDQLVAVQRMDLEISDPRARELAIADNRAAELSLDWDLEQLQALAAAGDIQLDSFFNADELAKMFPPELSGDEDDVPALPVEPRSKVGDLYVLGDHRLLCGDATNPRSLRRLVGPGLVDAVWTDPPYNVSYRGGTKAALEIMNDSMSDSDFDAFLAAVFKAAAHVLKPGGAIYVAHADTAGEQFRAAFREAGFHLASCLVWRKNSLVLGHADYQWRHEPILYGWKPGGAHLWTGGRAQTSIQELEQPAAVRLDDGSWQVHFGDNSFIVRGADVTVEVAIGDVFTEDKPNRNAEHPTMKPVALIERMLANSTAAGATVLDQFGGSGSTMIACEKLRRRCVMMELDPRYVDVIVDRWETATGRKATLNAGAAAGN